tara:strand:+ start:169 stop:1770 length:1602 start_codon:yes stop_codon:yes gene_type:complete
MEGGTAVAPMRAPRSVMYGDQLPLGIEAKSQKRLFFPTTGDTYSPTSNTICRIDINYDGLMDTAQSYLEFDLTNNSGKRASFDIGHPVIRKLTISSGGVVLEEIHDYNALVAGVLFPSQAGVQNLHLEGMNNKGLDQRSAFTNIAAGDAPCATTYANADNTNMVQVVDADIVNGAGSDGTGASAIHTKVDAAIDGSLTTYNGKVQTAVTNAVVAGVNAGGAAINAGGADVLRYSAPATTTGSDATARTGVFDNGDVFKQQYKLVSGLLDNDKYLPLVLMNAGITLEFELAPAVDCMVTQTATGADYSITNVRYVAHLIDLERSFYDRLRMVQQQSGGVLQIAGQSYRGFRATMSAATTHSLNCPARVRSIKSFFWKFSRVGNDATYNLSAGGHNNLTEYQLSIGATRYPPTPNSVNNATNKVAAYTELQKAFGKISSNLHPDRLNSANYLSGDGSAASMAGGDVVPFAPFGIDLESFRHEIENGVDTSSRALPITLHLTASGNPTAGAEDCQMWVLYDSLYYINMDGSVSVSN